MPITDLFKPLITEKAMKLAQSGQFSFYVHQSATKTGLAKAVRDLFKVDVTRVSIINLPSKTRRTGKKRLTAATGFRKKAVITLKPGQTIDYFQLPEEKNKKKKKTKTKINK